MPYIKQEERDRLDPTIDLIAEKVHTDGELNYVIFRLLMLLMLKWGMNYSNLNKLKGVMTCCSEEFSRRLVFPYEDIKIRENGDVC